MIQLKTKELHFDEELKKRIEFICDFCNSKTTIINGSIKSIKHTNIDCVKPHVLKVKGNNYLIFQSSGYIFVNGYKGKIKFE